MDIGNDEEVSKVVRSCLDTKLMSKWMELAVKIALESVKIVTVEESGRKEIDIKRYVRIEKVLSVYHRVLTDSASSVWILDPRWDD